MGQTITEKIFSRHNVEGTPVQTGDIIEAKVDAVRFQYGFGPRIKKEAEMMGFPEGLPRVFDPEKIYVFVDHHQPALSQALADSNVVTREEVKRLGIKIFQDAEPGIGHQMIMDRGLARPGMLIVGMDSHTISYGALNMLARAEVGGGAAYAALFGDLWFEVPPTIKINLEGHQPNYPISKDIILYLAGKYGDDFGDNKTLEFSGPLVEQLSMDSRMCIADHGVEVGGQFAVFPFDDKTEAYLKGRTDETYEPTAADPDAVYDQEITVNVDEMPFVVAKPNKFGNVAPIAEVAGKKIDQAMIGSCANGRFEDIEIAARMLKGKKVHDGVRFILSPSSQHIYAQCLKAGLITDLVEAGAQVVTPGCSICQPMVGFLSDGEVCISSTTRNYKGRKGSREAEIFLGGPLSVTAAAVAGELADPLDVFPELKN
ncbi:MAG: aconitase/3-isopropylmalate dehydratase large subunit family protein [Rhodospirillaceae bacterium]|jgi:3-isopropylmalate/(R)-2-methylmalate dehydratase large subunit